jgi:hypothetical protein
MKSEEMREELRKRGYSRQRIERLILTAEVDPTRLERFFRSLAEIHPDALPVRQDCLVLGGLLFLAEPLEESDSTEPTIEQIRALLAETEVPFSRHATYERALRMKHEIEQVGAYAIHHYFEFLGTLPWVVTVWHDVDIDTLTDALMSLWLDEGAQRNG